MGGEWVGAAVQGASGILGNILGWFENTMNIQAQERINDANIALQRESWDKNSITSRVQELEQNGLNKQLATGMSPNYSLQTSLKAPQSNYANTFSSNMGKVADAISTFYQLKLMEQQTENAKKQNDVLSAQASKINLDNETNRYILDVMKNRGIIPQDNTDVKKWQYIIQMLGDLIKSTKPNIELPVIELPKKDTDKNERKEAIKSTKKYGDAWKSDPYSYMPVKVNPHYK